MKQYVVDELRLQDSEKIRNWLDENLTSSTVDGIYWLPLDPGLLSRLQREHTDCQPYFFALELDEQRLSCELLVRTHGKVRCDCIAYATEVQRNWLIDWVDDRLGRLEIIS